RLAPGDRLRWSRGEARRAPAARERRRCRPRAARQRGGHLSSRWAPLPPPRRPEGAGEIEAADAGGLPDDLVRLTDVRGAVHCHTVHSDGRNTIEEMARAAEASGLQYLTITDHSASAHYAN